MASTKKYGIADSFNLLDRTINEWQLFKCDFTRNGQTICKIKFYAQNWNKATEYIEKIRSIEGVDFLKNSKMTMSLTDKM